MAEVIKRGDPTGYIARQLVSAGGGTSVPITTQVKGLTFGGTANGSLLSWQNPYDVAGMATVQFMVTTAGTGTAGVDIGVGTLGGSADNLIDAGLVNTNEKVRNSVDDQGTNGTAFQRMSAKGGTADYVTGKANDVDATAVASAWIMFYPIG